MKSIIVCIWYTINFNDSTTTEEYYGMNKPVNFETEHGTVLFILWNIT